MNDEEVREESKRFLEQKEKWPLWPFLPMKRYVKTEEEVTGVEIGVIGTVDPLVVFKCSWNNWSPNAPRQKYSSVDAILDDGWIVD